jgi:hypothetical protein
LIGLCASIGGVLYRSKLRDCSDARTVRPA